MPLTGDLAGPQATFSLGFSHIGHGPQAKAGAQDMPHWPRHSDLNGFD